MLLARCPAERRALLRALAHAPAHVFAHVAYWASGGQPQPLEIDPRWTADDRRLAHACQQAGQQYLERPL